MEKQAYGPSLSPLQSVTGGLSEASQLDIFGWT